MRKRETIQLIHERLLDTTSVDEAKEIRDTFYSELNLHENPADSFHTEEMKSRDAIQPINSALGELAWRTVTQQMSEQYSQSGSLERESEPREWTKDYSPTLRRFMATMDAWLYPAVQQVFNAAAAGEMPNAAIREIYSIERERRLEGHKRRHDSLSPEEQEKAGIEPEDPEEIVKESWTMLNLPLVTSSIIGTAIAAGGGEKPQDKVAKLLEDIDRITILSGLVREVTFPLLSEATEEILGKYFQWEQGELSAEDFLEHCQANILCSPNPAAECHPSLKNRPWKSPGHCAADMRVGRPEAFPVSPESFLRQIGVIEPGEITFTKLYVASGIVAARDTILTRLP